MCNIQNEMHYYIGPIQIYSGAEVSHTNRCRSVRRIFRHQCRSVRTLRHYNLVPKCPGAEVSRELFNVPSFPSCFSSRLPVPSVCDRRDSLSRMHQHKMNTKWKRCVDSLKVRYVHNLTVKFKTIQWELQNNLPLNDRRKLFLHVLI